jgi:hypothetical protein
MKITSIRMVVGAGLLLAAAGVAAEDAAEPAVAVKVDGLSTHVRSRIEAKAKQGLTALIQYLNTSRPVHQLRAEDIVKRADSASPTQVAQKPAAGDQVASKQ